MPGMMDPVIRKAAAAARMSLRGLAKRMGVAHSALHQWERVPAERVLELELATGVSRHDIRPDLYPRDGAPQSQSAEALP